MSGEARAAGPWRIPVRSTRANELIDITAELGKCAADGTCRALLVYVPHTTAGVLINENADPDVGADILLALDNILSQSIHYRHGEGNSPAHIKASLVGTSQLVPVVDGRLALGTWQGVFLAEFDGPRTRHVLVLPLA